MSNTEHPEVENLRTGFSDIQIKAIPIFKYGVEIDQSSDDM